MTRMKCFLLIAIVAVAGTGGRALFGGRDGQMMQQAVALLIGN